MQTISATRHIRKRPEQAARCRRSKKGIPKERTNNAIGNGFLKHVFQPLCHPSVTLPERRTSEQGFFKSLSILSELYRLDLPDYGNYLYPCNILLAHHYARKALNITNQEMALEIIRDDDDKIHLATKQVYDTGSTLYFIPVIPLYKLLQDRKQKRCGELLLSVFAYLYHNAGIPYYRDGYSPLSYYYEMHSDWILDDRESYEEEHLNRNLSDLNAAAFYGEEIFRKLYNHCQLRLFADRIANFRPDNKFQRDCLRIAKEAFAMMQQYGERSIFRNTNKKTEDDYYEETIGAEQYLSFVASTEGWLADQIVMSVNEHFNNCSEMEEPAIIQVFDDAHETQTEDLAFEHSIFPLIIDLATLLNEIP